MEPLSTEPRKAIIYSSSDEKPELHCRHTSTTGKFSGYREGERSQGLDEGAGEGRVPA